MLDRLWSDVRYRWRALTGRDRLERELDDELQFHVEQEARKHEARGVPPAEARRLALAAFGAADAVKDHVRDVRGIGWVERIAADLRHVFRSLLAHRAFTLGVMLTLALGIGVNVTMFGIVDRLLFRSPDGLRDTDRVHRVHLHWTEDGQRRSERHVAFARLLDFERQLRRFDLVAGFQNRTAALGTGDETRETRIAVVTPNYLEFFDAPPVLGRWFTAADDDPPGSPAVIVLGHGFWMTRYGGRTEVLGQRLQVDRVEATIIGVAPPGFTGVTDVGPPAVFVPMRTFAAAARGPEYATTYNWSWLGLLVRTHPSVTEAEATLDLTRAFRASWSAENALRGEPDDVARHDPVATVGPVHLGRGPDARLEERVAFWISGVAVLVFVIACANVANLFLARAVHRQRELAMRLALGVGRGRLTEQLFMESLALGTGGGGGGVILAWMSGGTLRSLLLPEGTTDAVLTDPRTLLFTFALAVAAGALTVLVPASMTARLDIQAALKSGGRGATRPRTRTQATLVVVQAALSVVLLVSAAAFVLSLQRAQAHRLGFDVDRLAYAEVNLRGTRLDRDATLALATRLEDTARTLPGVAHVSMAASVPFWSFEGRRLIVPGVDDVHELGRFTLQSGSTDYFATTGTRILRGRGFTSTDGAAGQLIIVVSEGMARAVWPDRDALGQCVRIDTGPPAPGRPRPDPACRTVVGVAEESAMATLEPGREFTYYVPVAQFPESASLQLFVRTDVLPQTLSATLRARLQPQLPGAAYVNVLPLAGLVAPQYRAWRFGATVFALFGGLALVLSALGLHSLVAYEVAQREQEFGVRVALGASPGQVLRLVLARGTRLVAAGIVAGLALALAVSGWLDALLFRQSTRDPMVLAAVAVTLLAVASMASVVPGLRATRIDPVDALRAE